jgi:hypothetical protein
MAAKNQASEFGAGNQFTASENAAQRALQTSLQESQQAFTGGQNAADRALMVQQDTFKANVDASLANINNSFKFDLQTQGIVGNLSQDFSKSLLAINQDVNMNQASKDYAIQQLYNNYKAQVSLLSAVGSVPDVSQLLNFDKGTTANPVNPTPTYTSADINTWLNDHKGASDTQIVAAMKQYGITVAQMAAATGLSTDAVQQRFNAAGG